MGVELELLAGLSLGLLAQGIFVGSEMALSSLDRRRLDRRISEGRGRSPHRALQSFLRAPTWILSTTLVGVNLALSVCAVFLVQAAYPHFGPWAALAVLALLPISVVLGDILPKSHAQSHPMGWSLRFIWPLRILAFFTRPWVAGMLHLGHALSGRNDNDRQSHPFVLREELRLRIKDQASTPELGPLEREMITNIFDFGATTTEEVMVPLIDVRAVEAGRPLLKAVERLVDGGFSRLPVFKDRIDNIVGMVYAFDLLYESDVNQPIAPFIRPAFYVSEATPVSRLLLEMRKAQASMAVVVDEYGGAQGLATLEDILEEIVGEIEDEYDSRAPNWTSPGPGQYVINARMEIEELEELLQFPLDDGPYETAAGLLLAAFRRIPVAGACHTLGPWTFTVTRCNGRVIQEIRVEAAPATKPANDR